MCWLSLQRPHVPQGTERKGKVKLTIQHKSLMLLGKSNKKTGQFFLSLFILFKQYCMTQYEKIHYACCPHAH